MTTSVVPMLFLLDSLHSCLKAVKLFGNNCGTTFLRHCLRNPVSGTGVRFDHRGCGGIEPEIQRRLFSHLTLFLHVASPCLSGAFGRKMRQKTRWMIAIHYVTG